VPSAARESESVVLVTGNSAEVPSAVAKRSVRPDPRRRNQRAVGIGRDRVAQTERPADAQHSAARVVHIERLFQGQRVGGSAEGEIGDADENSEIGGIDEDLRESGIAAGGALAEGIVGREAILAGAAERRPVRSPGRRSNRGSRD